MGYATLDDLKSAMSEQSLLDLSQDNPDLDELDLTVIDRALTDASELIDGYLRGRYILPITPTPSILRQLCVDIARYKLHLRRPEGGELPANISDSYKNALNILKAIPKGEFSLGDIQTQASTPEPGPSRVMAPARIFTDELLAGYGQ